MLRTCRRREGLLELEVPGKLCLMKRELIALILMIAVSLQGSMVASASISPLTSADCHTSATSHADAALDSCCPKGQRAMSCCLDLCLETAGATMSPTGLTLFAGPAELQAAKSPLFCSRSDPLLIRPPIR